MRSSQLRTISLRDSEPDFQPTRIVSPTRHSPLQVVPVVHLVDNDIESHEAIGSWLGSRGIGIATFQSAAEYLSRERVEQASCLIIDLHLPDMSGLDLQEQLAGTESPPIIFISRDPDFPSTVRAMKAGAIEFLMKPLDPEALHRSVRAASAREAKHRLRRFELRELKCRLSRLTPRERDVLPLVVGGLLNKQAASVLGISEVTLQIHRSQVMRKMEATSLADLVRMALKLGISGFSWKP